jgi:cytidylate kinase
MSSLPHEKLIQRQIHHWNRYKQLIAAAAEPGEVPPQPIITISRELGAGARSLAEALAERLDLEIHGVSLIDQIAQDKHLARWVVEQLDESVRSQIEMWVQGVLERRIFLRDEYHVSLVRAIRTLAAHGGVVFIGRGAHLVLGDSCSLRILLVASEATRARRVAQYEETDLEAARKKIAEVDEARREFIEKLFHVEADDPRQFDIVVNTDRLPLERLVELCINALEVRGILPEGVQSKQA